MGIRRAVARAPMLGASHAAHQGLWTPTWRDPRGSRRRDPQRLPVKAARAFPHPEAVEMTTTRMKIQLRNGNELADRPVGGRWPGWFTTDDAAALRVPATLPTCRFYRRGHAGDAVDAGEPRWHHVGELRRR